MSTLNLRGFAGRHLLAFLLPCALFASPSVAMVMDLKGMVRMVDEKEPLALLAELGPGSELRMDKGAHLVLVTLDEGEEIRVEGPARFTLDSAGRPVGKVKTTIKQVQALRLKSRLKPAGLAQASVMMKEVNLGDFSRLEKPLPKPSLVLQSPPSSVVREPRPRFAWAPIQDTTWLFILRDAEDRECLRYEGKANQAELPAQSVLAAGSVYHWSLEGLGTSLRGTGELCRLDKIQEATLKRAEGPKAPFARRVLHAVLLDQYGLQVEAKAEWQALQRERPEDPALRTLVDAER